MRAFLPLSVINGRENRGQACRQGRNAASSPTLNNSSCPSVWSLLDVYGEPETPSTQHRRLRLLRSSKTGDNSEQRSLLPICKANVERGSEHRERKAHEGERKFIFNLVTSPA